MQEAVLPPGLAATVTGVIAVEYGLVALAVVTLAALLVVRAKRDHDQKIRKAASVGYYDPDAARYWHGAVAPRPSEPAGDESARPLAPSFVAPGRRKAPVRRNAGVHPPPSVLSDFGPFAEAPSGPVPAFDPAAAITARPESTPLASPPAPPPPSSSPAPPPPPPPLPPVPPATAPSPPTTPLAPLPRLEQPPPPARPASERTESFGP